MVLVLDPPAARARGKLTAPVQFPMSCENLFPKPAQHILHRVLCSFFHLFLGLSAAQDIDSHIYLMLANDLIHSVVPSAVTVAEAGRPRPASGITARTDGLVGCGSELLLVWKRKRRGPTQERRYSGKRGGSNF